MFWVNIDKPTKTCVIHKEGCRYEQTKSETPLKGIEKFKPNGGWFQFPSIEKAEDYCKREWEVKGYIVRRGYCCFPKT